MFKNWNFWFTAVTAIVAVIALFQTSKQIKLSNKHQLFDRRINAYLRAKELISLFSENSNIWAKKREDTPHFSNDFDFLWLTNNVYLQDIFEVIKTPLENPGHKLFLSKQEELKNTATEIKLIFSGKEADLLGDFVLKYEENLFAIYQYQIVLDKMKREKESLHCQWEKAQKLTNEQKHRKQLEAALNNLIDAYKMLEKKRVEEKIIKQIQLI